MITRPFSTGPRHAKTCLQAYADSEDPDQPAHARSLIRIFTVRWQNHWIIQNVWMNGKDPDDTLRMRRMIWMRILRMFEGTFSLEEAQLTHSQTYYTRTIIARYLWHRHVKKNLMHVRKPTIPFLHDGVKMNCFSLDVKHEPRYTKPLNIAEELLKRSI